MQTEEDKRPCTLSEIRTHDLSVQAIKAYALDRAATDTNVPIILIPNS
jgi:hypothetical protein